MTRARPGRTARAAVLMTAAAIAAPAGARTVVTPYLEVQQVFSADLSQRADLVTYSGVGGGIDVSIDDRRLKGQADYRYDHYFAWTDRATDTDLHSGLARLSYAATRDLTLEAGGIATRARGSLLNASPALFLGTVQNTQQIYGGQFGPSYARRFGALDVKAAYRLGIVRNENGSGIDPAPGQPTLNPAFDTVSHSAEGSVGETVASSSLPFGWTVSAGAVRDTIGYLDTRYEGSFVRGEVTRPVSPTLALVGRLGYEWNSIGQRPVLVDDAGAPILDGDNRLRGDTSRPRALLYDQDGLLWDVGVLWRPGTRLSAELRGGRRYGAWAVTGNLLWKVGAETSVQAVAYNDIQSFGRQLGNAVGGLSTSFVNPTGLFAGGLTGGCVFGSGGAGGTCLSALASSNPNFFRSRGVYALVSSTRGRWTAGLGAGYDHRTYIAPALSVAQVSYAGVADDTVTVNALLRYGLSRVSTVSASVFAAWYDTALLGGRSTSNYGITTAYTREIGRSLTGQASISVYSGAGGGVEQDVIGSALLGLRYRL